ncbi:MAG: M16 family metallopeptidase [Flavobacteriales bacterium]
MIKTLIISTTVLSTITVGAQNREIKFTEFDLDNGLHVILHEDHSTPIVAVSVLYHVGSKNEKPDRTGFAHFFEHLLFEGSENIERGKFAEHVESNGGVLNAYTSNDKTFYFNILPSNQLELGLWLESERMLHAKVDIVGVETQREVVKEEKRLRVDNQPYGSLIEEIMKRAFKVHPYRWMPIGSMEHLNAASEEDYKEFYKTFYVPNNAVLSIAGSFDSKQAKELITRYFKDIPKGGIAKPVVSMNEPPLEGEIRDTIFDNIQLPAVVQAYRIPEQTHPDAYALDMLTMLMSQGNSSRLQKRSVDETQSALFIGMFPFSLEHPGVALTFGICNQGVDPAKLEAEMNEEIGKLKKELISDKEMERLMNQIENDFVNNNKNMMSIADNLASAYVFRGNTNYINEEMKKYTKITKEDIRRVANQYLKESNRVVLYYLPKDETEN